MNQSPTAAHDFQSCNAGLPEEFYEVCVTAGLVWLDETRLTAWLAQFRQETGLRLDFRRAAGVYAVQCLPGEVENVREMVLSVGLASLLAAMREYYKECGHLNDAEIDRCLESPFSR